MVLIIPLLMIICNRSVVFSSKLCLDKLATLSKRQPTAPPPLAELCGLRRLCLDKLSTSFVQESREKKNSPFVPLVRSMAVSSVWGIAHSRSVINLVSVFIIPKDTFRAVLFSDYPCLIGILAPYVGIPDQASDQY